MQRSNILAVRNFMKNQRRWLAEPCGSGQAKKGLVLGGYDGCNPGQVRFTDCAARFDESVSGKLKKLLEGTDVKRGECLVFSNLCSDFDFVALAGLGKKDAGFNHYEQLDECKENIRVGAGVGARALQDRGVTQIFVEGFTNTEAAAEGAILGVWKFQEYRDVKGQDPDPKVELYEDPDREGWSRGALKADSQNIARKLEEAPANQMTPKSFAKSALDILCPCGVQVDVRDQDWLELKKMNAFLAMARGSCEAPLFLELGYCGSDPGDKPVVLVGKGVTFDSGGLCLKPCEGMDAYRGDLAGAAVVVAVLRAIARMNLPINVLGVIPLCENMLSGLSLKPGDVVMGLNGKSIRVENTDHDGRVALSDALVYTDKYKPCLIMSVSTLTRGMKKVLGSACSGVFSTTDVAWRELLRAGGESGDRVWRFPFWSHYSRKVTGYKGVDVNNVGKGSGSACLGAAFLLEFVPRKYDFVHVDITGTGMLATGVGHPYLRKGTMTGRPTRTLIQFIYQMACPHEKGHEC